MKEAHTVNNAPSEKRRKRLASWLFRLLMGAFLIFLFVGAGVAAYCLYLSSEIDKRFSGRRWSIPSMVYSDTTILFPGQKLNRPLLEKKLDLLGYRRVIQKPEEKGQVRIAGSTWQVFLNDLRVPNTSREGFPVEIKFEGNRIVSIVHLVTGKILPLVEIEPELLMHFFGPQREQRRLVSIKEVPPHVIHAVIAIEDSRFYEHHGIDPVGILRALYSNIRHAGIRQGGSTITQQLAKNYFLTPERTISRKVKESLFALTMEAMYDKNEILEIYLNEIYLGQMQSVSINGIGEASRFYFGKTVDLLTLDEGAIIAGLIRAPNSYSPYLDKKRCEDRRNRVLQAMQKHGWISGEQLQSALSKPIQPSGYEGYKARAPYFIDYVSKQLSSLYSSEALASLGLSIYTTLDTQVQLAAEKALASGLHKISSSGSQADPVEGAVVVMQPKTGYILAMVGGRDYHMSQFNRLTQARRQPGSAFKPFVYLSALDQFTPATLLSNEPKTYDVDGKPWQPQNFSPEPATPVTMRNALAKSINLATVDLAVRSGLDHVVETASAFGFSTPLRPFPSLALGAAEVIPLELARAYCAFAADGMLPHPLSVNEVVDEKGVILERRQMTVERVTTPAKAFIISSMLRSAVEEGTGRSLRTRGIEIPLAGKTGTTNDFRDGWFIGYTPDIMALVWVGHDHGAPLPGQGSQVALPIWADLLKAIPHHVSGDWFKIPPGVVQEEICVESGQVAVSGCPKRVREYFLEENVPKERCSLHQPVERFIKGIKDLFKSF